MLTASFSVRQSSTTVSQIKAVASGELSITADLHTMSFPNWNVSNLRPQKAPCWESLRRRPSAYAMATSECLPCEYDPTLDNRQRKTSPLATTAFAFVEAMDEPCHVTILLTPWMRLMRLHRVSSERPVPTEWHRHTADSLYLFLADADVHTQTDAQAAPVLTHANAEAAFFAPHSRAPLVHQGEAAPRPAHRSLQRRTHAHS